MKLNPETINVLPFNKEKLSKHFSKYIELKENQSFIIDTDSVFITDKDSLLIDNECCAGKLERKINKITKKIEWVVSLGIRRETSYEGGSSIPMSYECYIDIYESEFPNLLDAPISLKDFMVGRYNYNPRIIKNTREIVQVINDLMA